MVTTGVPFYRISNSLYEVGNNFNDIRWSQVRTKAREINQRKYGAERYKDDIYSCVRCTTLALTLLKENSDIVKDERLA
jgi:hypothetical protein